MRGVIRAEWRRKGDSLYYAVTVPEGVTGTVVLPGKYAMVGKGHYRYRVRVTGAYPVIRSIVGPDCVLHTETVPKYKVIPYPAVVSSTDGWFVIDRKTEIVRETKPGLPAYWKK